MMTAEVENGNGNGASKGYPGSPGNGSASASGGGGGSPRRALHVARVEPLPWEEMNPRQKMKHVIANITVEPILLFYIIPNLLSNLTTQNLNLEKACRVNLNFSTEQCDAFTERNITDANSADFGEVTKLVADMQVWMTPIQSAVPIILVLFVGSWSDRRRRRKPFLLSPLFGELFVAIGLLLCSIFYLDWPLEVAGVIEAIFPALSGGMTILLMSVFSYVADLTTVEVRTFRIGLVCTVVSCAFPIAIALSGVLYEALGFIGMYILGTLLYAIGIAYAFFYVREPHPPVPRPQGVSFLSDFCNWRHVWETVKVALVKRPGSRQLQFFMVVLMYISIQGPIQGEATVAFLYVTERYHWDAIAFSAYGTYSILIGAAGNLVVATVMSRWLKLDDCIIGMIAMVAKTLSAPLYAFANTTWQIYLVTASDILGSGALIAMRAVATKLVDSDELGKLMALLAVVEAIIPLVFRPIYSKVFSTSKESLPGAFFFISCVVSLVGFLLYLFIYILQKKQTAQEAEHKKNEADDEIGGVVNTGFQGDKTDNIHMRTRGTENTAL